MNSRDGVRSPGGWSTNISERRWLNGAENGCKRQAGLQTEWTESGAGLGTSVTLYVPMPTRVPAHSDAR